MSNDIFVVQVLKEDNEVETKIMTCNGGKAIEWSRFYVDDLKYEESWILRVKFTEVNFQFALLEKCPCVYLLTQHGLRFNNI